ncbi:DUF3386 family protein [Nonomuraea sp. NPDC050663]|uniref:DUF3386 family protein n=1 Tax=Nonomuraea sp. NPDC050663 TaxID=3364370 RepID=UPI003789EBC5
MSDARLVEQAHAATYRWPLDLAGFEAELVLTEDGQAHNGHLSVELRPGKPPKVSVSLEGAATEQVHWTTRQLTRIVTHRQETPFAKELTVVPEEREHPMGVLLKADDRFSSLFRVRGDWITEVTRTMADTVNRVFHLRRESAPDGRHLPAVLASTRSSLDGQIVQVELIEDTYAEAGGLMFPRSRSVISQSATGVHTRLIELIVKEVAR